MSRPRDACAPRRAEAGAPGVCRPPCLGGSSRVSAGRPASVRRLRQPGDGRGGSQASADGAFILDALAVIGGR